MDNKIDPDNSGFNLRFGGQCSKSTGPRDTSPLAENTYTSRFYTHLDQSIEFVEDHGRMPMQKEIGWISYMRTKGRVGLGPELADVLEMKHCENWDW